MLYDRARGAVLFVDHGAAFRTHFRIVHIKADLHRKICETGVPRRLIIKTSAVPGREILFRLPSPEKGSERGEFAVVKLPGDTDLVENLSRMAALGASVVAVETIRPHLEDQLVALLESSGHKASSPTDIA